MNKTIFKILFSLFVTGAVFVFIFTMTAHSFTGSVSESVDSDNDYDLEEKEMELSTMLNGFLDVNPDITEMPQYNPDSNPEFATNMWSNIKAITFDGAEIDGKKTKVFAYIGFPENSDISTKVPAVVLIHGGGGTAFAEWIKIWTDRGYAAIAMCTTGYFPSPSGKGKAGRENDDSFYWQYGLYGDFSEIGYVNAPNNDAMDSSGNEIDSQWMYHAVAQSILAHNILRNDSRVDNDRIGVTGVSWGGIICSIAIGYDTRYSFAIPVYGAGYLDNGLSYMYDFFSLPETKALWSADTNFDKVKIPVLWLGWSIDPHFSIQSNSLSYVATKKAGSILGIKTFWSHGHSSAWSSPEIYRFADSVIKDSQPLTECITEPGTSKNISFTIKKPSDTSSVTARAWYLTEKMTYSMMGIYSSTLSIKTIDQQWSAIDCTVDGNTVTGTLPDNTDNFYVEITTNTSSGTYITSTKYVTINPEDNSSEKLDNSLEVRESQNDTISKEEISGCKSTWIIVLITACFTFVASGAAIFIYRRKRRA